MIVCPFCDAENIPGSDVCDQCGQALAHLHLTPPATQVERSLLKGRIRDIHPKKPIVVAPDVPVGEVIRLMAAKQIGCIFVVDGESIAGVFSERDALMRIGPDFAEVAECPVSQFMTPNPQSLDAEAKIAFGVRMMDLGGYRHIPVVDGKGKPTGVISVRDILRYLSDIAAVNSP